MSATLVMGNSARKGSQITREITVGIISSGLPPKTQTQEVQAEKMRENHWVIKPLFNNVFLRKGVIAFHILS